MMDIFQGSDLDEIVNEMLSHMRTQIENPELRRSGLSFNRVLNINFHQLNLTRGNSYLPLPKWIASKNSIINTKNGDDECF